MAGESLSRRCCVLLSQWKFFFIFIAPIAFIPLVILGGQEGKCAYVILLMASYWMVEALPLAVTSLLPCVLFPVLGVQSTKQVAPNYMNSLNTLFIGGLIISIAVEFCNLHKRIALRVILLIGCSPMRIVLGIMLTAMFLSMWMSNTATTAMMVPIVMAILDELNKSHDIYRKSVAAALGPSLTPSAVNALRKKVRLPKDSETSTTVSEARSSGATTSTEPRDSIVDEEPGIKESNAEPQDEEDVDIEEEVPVVVPPQPIGPDPHEKNRKRLHLLAIAYASNIGGTGTITGTAPNLILIGKLQEDPAIVLTKDGGMDLTFPSWMAYAIPSMLLNTLVAWLYLIIYYTGVPSQLAFWRPKKSAVEQEAAKQRNRNVYKVLRERYLALGPMTYHEIAVAAAFGFVVLLWLTREPGVFPGWGYLLKYPEKEKGVPTPKYVSDGSAALLIVVVLFIIPKDPRFLIGSSGVKFSGLVDWKYIQSRFPWGVLLLMGAGFAISDAAQTSGLATWLGKMMKYVVQGWPIELTLFTFMFLTAFITEVASNAAVASVVTPIAIALADKVNFHPLYLSLPAAIACSYAFMLPAVPASAIVATPPNAIVQAAGGTDIRIIDMAKPGLFLNVSCVIIHFLVHISWGNVLFDYNADRWNRTATASTNIMSTTMKMP